MNALEQATQDAQEALQTLLDAQNAAMAASLAFSQDVTTWAAQTQQIAATQRLIRAWQITHPHRSARSRRR